MTPNVRRFRDTAIEACRHRCYPFHRLMADGLEGVLAEAEGRGLNEKQIVALFLSTCCVENNRFNNFQVGILIAVTYLCSVYKLSAENDQQVFVDLLAVLNGGGSYDMVLAWAESNC